MFISEYAFTKLSFMGSYDLGEIFWLVLVGTEIVFITFINITRSDLSKVSAKAISVIKKLFSFSVISVHSDCGFEGP